MRLLRLPETCAVIVTRVMGGLGNQLFQYAAARALAKRHETSVVLDLSWFERRPRTDTPRALLLDRLAVVARPAQGAMRAVSYVQTLPVARRVAGALSPWRPYHEKGFGFDPRVPALPDDTHLMGYWQSFRYFDDLSQTLRGEFTAREPSVERHALEDAIAATESVSVHVRRGDYANRPHVAAYHGTCSPAYYEKAAAHIAQALGRPPEFFVFSDDPDWAEANLKLPGTTHIVRQQVPDPEIADLRLMSLCRHHIIANSSFSWWGAWLNPRNDKMVVAPERWFATPVDTSDLLPATWVRM